MELNVLGTQLQPCCADPATGYFRDGLLYNNLKYTSIHIIYTIMTTELLDYTKFKENGLSTPILH